MTALAFLKTPERRLLILAALVRLFPALLIFGTEDISAHYDSARMIAAGENPYLIPRFLVWPPVWPVLSFLSYLLAEAAGIPFWFAFKLFPIAADVALTRALLSRQSYFTAALYAFNPVSIYVTAIHGNFDAIPSLFLTLAILAAARTEDDPKGVRAGTWLGIGAAVKTYPLLILPALIAPPMRFWRRVTIALVAVGIFFAALLLPWPVIGRAAIDGVLRYRGLLVGWWGITSIEFLTGATLPDAVRSAIFYGAMGGAALLLLVRRSPAAVGALFLLLTFFLTTAGFGLQYLLWIVPVAIVADQRRAIVYSALAGLLILIEITFRPWTGHFFDPIRLLPHSDFARNYGGPVDQRNTAIGRLVLWLFFAFWWVATLVNLITRHSASRPIGNKRAGT